MADTPRRMPVKSGVACRKRARLQLIFKVDLIASPARKISVHICNVAVPTIFSPDTPCELYRRVSGQAQTLWPVLLFCVGGGNWEAASRILLSGPFLTSEVKRKATRDMPKFVARWSALVAGVATFAFPANSFAAPEENISIETLLKAGWQIAGYTSTLDSRSAFILFRHAGRELPRAVPRKLRRNPHACRPLALLQAGVALLAGAKRS